VYLARVKVSESVSQSINQSERVSEIDIDNDDMDDEFDIYDEGILGGSVRDATHRATVPLHRV